MLLCVLSFSHIPFQYPSISSLGGVGSGILFPCNSEYSWFILLPSISPTLTLKLRLPNVQRLPNLWESLLGSLQALTYGQPAANSYKNSLHTAFILASSGIISPVLIPCPCRYFLSPVVHFSTLCPGSPTPDRDLRWHPSQYGFIYLSHSCLTYT